MAIILRAVVEWMKLGKHMGIFSIVSTTKLQFHKGRGVFDCCIPQIPTQCQAHNKILLNKWVWQTLYNTVGYTPEALWRIDAFWVHELEFMRDVYGLVQWLSKHCFRISSLSITWNLLEIQIPRLHTGFNESEILGVGPSNLVFTSLTEDPNALFSLNITDPVEQRYWSRQNPEMEGREERKLRTEQLFGTPADMHVETLTGRAKRTVLTEWWNWFPWSYQNMPQPALWP